MTAQLTEELRNCRYPKVADEFETVRQLVAGKSIARFGDGELKVAYGYGYVRSRPIPEMTAEICKALTHPYPDCLVGIPTMDPKGPKYEGWVRHRARFSDKLNHSMPYYSAFVSRPDSAPWINVREYAELFTRVWKGKHVVAVCERENSILRVLERTALSVKNIVCPHDNAYDLINVLEESVIRNSPEVAILSCGPTATCLANRLARHGVQAVDIGSAGGFLRKLLYPKNHGAKT